MKVFWFCVVVICAGWAYGITSPVSDEITVYQLICDKPYVSDICESGKEHAASRSTYKVFVDQQRVVYRFDDGTIGKFKDCAVIDTKNWMCKEAEYGEDNYHEFKMNDGQYSVFAQDIFMRSLYADKHQVPRWKWLWITAIGK